MTDVVLIESAYPKCQFECGRYLAWARFTVELSFASGFGHGHRVRMDLRCFETSKNVVNLREMAFNEAQII